MRATPLLRIIGDRQPSWYPEKPDPPVYKKPTRLRGKLKVAAKDVLATIDFRGTRFKCVGGPLDGETLASFLYVRTGRGKRTAHISIPLMPESFNVESEADGKGTYVWHDERSEYWWQSGSL